jgi:sortase (surface protein transpeptidase)
MPTLNVPAPQPGRVPRRGRLLAVRAAIMGAALICVTACGAAGAMSTGSADGGASSAGAASTNAAPTITAPTSAAATSVVAGGISEAGSPSEPDGTVASSPAVSPTAGSPAAEPAPAAPIAPASLVLPASTPVSVSVPAIGINSPLIVLGRNPDGTVEVPSLDDPDSTPGWYRNSPSPGTLGPAIILGHVDSRAFGPGVFYSLQNLQPSDIIDVARADGTIAEFSIDSVETVQKSDFPTLRVYGNLDHAGLRLITCGGEFDPAASSYESNIIVFASLVGSRSA